MPSAREVRDHLRDHLRDGLRDPVAWTSSIQLVKTVVAAVLAWVLAAEVIGLPQAYLAPWSALLVVHATVYRTFSEGAQQVTSTVLGVLLSWAVGNLLGVSWQGLLLLTLAGLMVGSLGWFRSNSTTVASTGLIVLTTGYSTQDQMLVDRMLATGVGIAVGLLVNLLVWPPLRDYSAARAIDAVDDEIAALLCDMAAQLEDGCDGEDVDDWIDRTRDLDEDLDSAWSMVRQAKESGRLNPRRAAKGLTVTKTFEEVLRDDEQAVAEARSMARTLRHSYEAVNEWDPLFRRRWVALLAEAGAAIRAPDSERVAAVRRDLGLLAQDLSDANLSGRHWPEYGALIMNLRNVVTSMDRVAQENPLSVPRYVRRDRLLRR
jgi:hypothetical protein